MATKIPVEILIKILNNNTHSAQDLYSLLLVNRFWCKVIIPILWELPLGQECCINDKKLAKKALCIRTYISCLDTKSRAVLTQNEFDLSLSPPQATFDYPSFAHKLIINNLVYFIFTYSQQLIDPDQDNNIDKSRILFGRIFKLIVDRCSFVDYFKLAGVPENFSKNFGNYDDLIGLIFRIRGSIKAFRKLKSFTSMIKKNKNIFPLYESLNLICDNISNMDLTLTSLSQMALLEKLIRVQKNLENLSITNSIITPSFWSSISKKETLKSLRLKKINFFYIRGESLGKFSSLQELYMEECFKGGDCALLDSSFTQLSSFHLRQKYYRYPQEFIIKIFETSNTKLRKIYLDLKSYTTTLLASLNRCTNIIKLTLHNSCAEHVIAIFNNDFNELRRFSFDFLGYESEAESRRFEIGKIFFADKLLCQMAENVPKSLETIIIKMEYDNPWIFSADSLRKFFEGWCCKGGEVNKKLRRFRIKRSLTSNNLSSPFDLSAISNDHFKVIEEYGIRFDIKE